MDFLFNWFIKICQELSPAVMLLWPVFLFLGIFCFHNWKRRCGSFLFSVYLAALYRIVGMPDITYFRFAPAVNVLPLFGLSGDWRNAVLNVLLFLPLGLLLPLLWQKIFRFKKTLITGVCLSAAIELLQIFTWRTTDVNDIITNVTGTALGCLIAEHLNVPESEAGSAEQRKEFGITLGSTLAAMFFVYPLIV